MNPRKIIPTSILEFRSLRFHLLTFILKYWLLFDACSVFSNFYFAREGSQLFEGTNFYYPTRKSQVLTFVLSWRERILTYILEKLLLTYIFGCERNNLLTFIFCRWHLLTSKNRLRRRVPDDLLTYILDTNFYFCSRKPRCYWLLLTYGFKMNYWLIVYPWEKYLLTSVLFSFCSTTPNARQAIYKASRSKRVVKEWETANHFLFSC